jgi:hypothetical protein
LKETEEFYAKNQAQIPANHILSLNSKLFAMQRAIRRKVWKAMECMATLSIKLLIGRKLKVSQRTKKSKML